MCQQRLSGLDPEVMYSLTDYAGRMLVLRGLHLTIARIARHAAA
jgi:hypothetical protein